MDRSFLRLLGFAVASTLALGGAVGCGQVERTMTITSDPSGALVYVNGIEKGRTPVTMDFKWYGDYRFVLRKDGYETLKTNRHVRAAWHQWIGMDVMTELFYPGKLVDHKDFHFELVVPPAVNEEQLIIEAKRFRDDAIYGTK
jgi:hypothetical protein